MEKTGHDNKPQPAGRVDALLLCGDRGASKPIRGESKAFLPLKGEPFFYHVLKTLETVESIGRVFVIGDKRRLDSYLSGKLTGGVRAKPVITIEQGRSLLENVWSGFIATLDGYEPGDEKTVPKFMNKVIFALPCDTPLISSLEINDFIDRADMDKYDYVAGLTSSCGMEKYYPSKDAPGIRMAYMHVREGLFRINNLHMARPFAFTNRELAQEIYEARYQKKFRNFARVTKDLLKLPGVRYGIWHYFVMQTSLLLSRMGLKGISNLTRRLTNLGSVLNVIEGALGARAGYVATEQGGAALDIDNEKDYIAMEKMYDTWKSMQKSKQDDTASC